MCEINMNILLYLLLFTVRKFHNVYFQIGSHVSNGIKASSLNSFCLFCSHTMPPKQVEMQSRNILCWCRQRKDMLPCLHSLIRHALKMDNVVLVCAALYNLLHKI